MLWRAANARPRLDLDVKIVGQDAEGDTGLEHLGSIVPGDLQANSPCLSGDALLPPGKTVKRER
jgi:hypothetical protein